MGSQYYWTNDDGLIVPSGRRTVENGSGSKSGVNGAVQEIVMVAKQGETGDATAQLAYGAVIPAGATIVDVELHSDGALIGLVDLIVGLTDEDGGSDITDADALVLAIDAAEVVGLRPGGSVVGTLFDGAALTASFPLTEAAIVTWAATTASAAGDVTIVVKFVIPADRNR